MFLSKLLGDPSLRATRALHPLVENIGKFEALVRVLDNNALREKTNEFKMALAEGRSPDDILSEAFAVVREAATRTLGQRHFDVQLMGGMVLHEGKIAEMKTGEGKTLVATLSAYLNALSGKGVHIVTVNDYLSRRDAVWMGQVYHALGLTVGVINHDASFLYDPAHETKDSERDALGSFKVVHEFLRPVTRRDAYHADITYGTNNEFGFDYLRDNLEYEESRLRQREFNYAIVDEIDSILIDEARTPLIISAPTAESENLYGQFAKIAETLKKDDDYTVDEKFKQIILTDSGINKAEKVLGVDNIYTDRGIKYVHHLETAVRAKALYEKDKQYVVREGEVVIVDEFTGRLQPGRRWSEGLHQAIEAKEGVAVQKESRTFASITFQNYFRMYRKLSGMTGTALTSSEEFYKVYALETIAIPTNRAMQRMDHNDLIFRSTEGKFKAITKKVKELSTKGQPVLVGTVSIENNELLSNYFTRAGIRHEVLNAKNHEREGEIIAQAGRKGAVTIATNMAGRGVDIKLGGNPTTVESYEEIKKLGGLFVLGTERHDARRIDNQLRGRSARQGDPGETQFFISLDDDLMRIFASDMIRGMMGKLGVEDDEPIENYLITRSLENAQKRIEGFNFDARKHVLEFDDVLNHQRQSVYERRRKFLLAGEEELEAMLGLLLGEANEEERAAITLKKNTLGAAFYPALRQVALQSIDMLWVEHLEMMDYMRGSVNLRAYGHRDPLVEYKKEGLHLFKEMQASINDQILKVLPHVNVSTQPPAEKDLGEVALAAKAITRERSPGSSAQGQKVGRNDPCPCGSGKKWKKCGQIGTKEHNERMAALAKQ
ncbi:MAG: preprotein translocase subunit SecA [bacterium]|nr:preprotein translocase subunit SecA [bacterium]